MYEQKVAQRVGVADPSLMSWMPSLMQALPSQRNTPLMAEEIITELQRSEWFQMDDRVVFLNKLLMSSQGVAHGAGQVLSRELQILDSPSFIQEKQARVHNLAQFLTLLRAQCQRWIDSSVPTLGALPGSGVVAYPSIDLFEEEGQICIKCSLPGIQMDKAFVGVVNQGTCLEISGETPYDEKKSYLRKEIPCGKFKRVIQLPAKVEEDSADATMTDGLLTVKLKKAGAQKIEVS